MNPPAALGHLSRLLLSRLEQRARLEVDELVMDSAYEYSFSCVCFVHTAHTHTQNTAMHCLFKENHHWYFRLRASIAEIYLHCEDL